MQNRTLAIVITVVTALACGCASIFSCVWGFLIASGTPIDVTNNGVTTPQTLSRRDRICTLMSHSFDDPGAGWQLVSSRCAKNQ